MRVEVIVSHPAKQANIYFRPLAAQDAGFETRFLTGLYFGCETVTALKRAKICPRALVSLLARRSQPELLRSNVTVLPPSVAAECILRPIGRIRTWDHVHDFWASRWLLAKKPSVPAVVHGYQGSCLRTLGTARTLGLTTLYEVMLAKPDALEDSEHSPGRVRTLKEAAFADCVLSLSAFSTDWLGSLGIPRSKILTFPMGVDTDLFSPRQESGDALFRVLFVGRIQKRKGVEFLCRAWSQLSLPNSELVIVGSGKDADVSRLRQLAGQSKITFAGFIPNDRLTAQYNAASIFVLPSFSEGDPNAVREALSCGLPCIVSTAAQSFVRSGKEGLVINAGDVQGLVTAISRLHKDVALRREMSLNARRRALDFSWLAYRRKLGGVYRTLLEGGNAAQHEEQQTIRSET